MEQLEALIDAGDYENAQKRLEERREADAAEPQWHYAAGVLAERRGETEAAIASYREALALDPEDDTIMFRLAYALDLRGDDEEAMKLYESCTRQTPTYVNALMNLAVLYEDQGKYELAERCLADVLGSYPNHPRARLFYKDVHSALHMYYDEDQERSREQNSAILDTPVSDFELSVRSRNCLKKMNINRLGDLLRVSETELLAYKNFGETSLNEIKAMLAQKGLRLGQATEESTSGAAPRTSQIKPEFAPGVPPEVLSKPVAELELSVRSRKCLQRLNITTIGELAMRTEAELLGTKNFGQTSLNEIKQRLKENNLGLRRIEE